MSLQQIGTQWMDVIHHRAKWRTGFCQAIIQCNIPLCQRVSSNYFLPGALQYKASSPQAQQAAMNLQPVCTGPAPSLKTTPGGVRLKVTSTSEWSDGHRSGSARWNTTYSFQLLRYIACPSPTGCNSLSKKV